MLFVLLAGCIDAKPLHEDEVVQVKAEKLDVPLFGPETHEVLIVVDDSPAMAAHRGEVQALARAIPGLLERRHYGIPELNLAVTTSDPQHRGELTTGTAQLGGRYLTMNRVGDGTWYTDYRGDFGDAIAQMVDVGAAGEPGSVLDAMLAALRANTTTGFLRPGAGLHGTTVIVISAGDDTGAEPPESYAQALQAFDPNAIAIALHAGDAPRLSAFASASDHQLGDQPATALQDLMISWSLLELPCLNVESRDVDPVTPGVQRSCTAELDNDGGVSLELTECRDGDTRPCYALSDDVACDLGTNDTPRIDIRNVHAYRPGKVVFECETGN